MDSSTGTPDRQIGAGRVGVPNNDGHIRRRQGNLGGDLRDLAQPSEGGRPIVFDEVFDRI